MKSSVNEIEQKDLLLKMAIEGGFYCSRGMKRASQEIVEDTIMSKVSYQGDDPIKTYETKIRINFQKYRRHLVQGLYHAITNKRLPQVISEDPHNFDVYQIVLMLGFYPISTLERQSIGITEIFYWSVYSFFRSNLEDGYYNSLYYIMEEERDDLHFTVYIRSLIYLCSLEWVYYEEKRKLLFRTNKNRKK